MERTDNIHIRHVRTSDKDFWFASDKHLPESEFEKKVRDKQGYVILKDDRPIGLLRYNLFWDNTPFCTLLYIDNRFRKNGYGKMLMNFWEKEMLPLGYDRLLVSTRSDETSQYFYRKLGYRDCGSLIVPDQAPEIFLEKPITHN